MLNIPDSLKTILKQDYLPYRVPIRKQLVLYFADLDLTITDEDFTDGDSFSLEDNLCGDELTFGDCGSACMKFKVEEIDNDLVGKKFTAKYIMEGTDIELGTFIVTEAKKEDNDTTKSIVAYDLMYLFNKDVLAWYDGLTYPMSLKAFRNSLCTYCGVEYVDSNLPNDTMNVEKTISTNVLNGREVLSKCEELNGCFGHMNRDGKLDHIVLTKINPVETITAVSYDTLKFEEYTTDVIDKVQIRTEDGDIGAYVGTGTNCYSITANYLVYGKTAASLSTICTNLSTNILGVTYRPYESNMQGLPYLNIGDYIKFEGNETANTYIMQRTLSGTQILADKASAKGSKTLSEDTSNNVQIEQLKGKSNVLKRDVEGLSNTVTSLETTTGSQSQAISRLETSLSVLTEDVDGVSGDIANVAKDVLAEVKRAQGAESSIDGKFSSYSTTTQMNSAIEQKANSITSSVSETYATKATVSNNLSTAKSYADTVGTNTLNSAKSDATSKANQALEDAKSDTSTKLTSYSTTSQMNTAITQSATSIKNEVSSDYTTKAEFGALEVGGRNYLLCSKGNSTKGYFKNNFTVTDEYAEVSISSQKQYSKVSLAPGFLLGCRDYEVGSQYTYSYDIMFTQWDFPTGSSRGEWWMGQRYTNAPTGETATGTWRGVTMHSLPVIGADGCELNKWYRVEKVITIPEQASANVGTDASIQFYNPNADVKATVTLRLKNVKLEKGNKATDWTPAPEDVDASIEAERARAVTIESSLQSSIEQTDKSITSVVSRTDKVEKEVYGLLPGNWLPSNSILPRSTVISNLESELTSKINQTAKEITTEVNNVSDQLNSQISQTSTQITTQVNDLTNNMNSQFTQTAAEISTKVEKNGIISSINQSAESVTINANKINLTGYATFSGLSDGTTVINGGCIKTGQIDAERIKSGTLSGMTLSGAYIDCYSLKSMSSSSSYTELTAGNIEIYTAGYHTSIDGTGITIKGRSVLCYGDTVSYASSAGSASTSSRCATSYLTLSGGTLTADNGSLYIGQNTVKADTITQTSTRKCKKNITKFNRSALKIINNASIKEFRYKHEDKAHHKHIGVIVEESDNVIINDERNGVDLGAMTSLSWKAIQELGEELKECKELIRQYCN